MKGLGTDEKTLINIVARRPNWHLQKVREEFEKIAEKDLVNYIADDTSYNFKKLLVALVKSRAESRADDIYHAMKGLGTNEHALIDNIIHVSDGEMEAIKQMFRQKYNSSMDEWVKGDTSGNFEKLLLHAMKNVRGKGVIPNLVDSDAEALYKGGEGKWGTDDKLFVQIFTERSFEHLQAVNQRYTEKRGHDLVHAIKHETTGWYKVALLSCLLSPITYWTERCHEAIAGLGTDDKLLVRCFSELSQTLPSTSCNRISKTL